MLHWLVTATAAAATTLVQLCFTKACSTLFHMQRHCCLSALLLHMPISLHSMICLLHNPTRLALTLADQSL
jgi:hypothetical protein